MIVNKKVRNLAIKCLTFHLSSRKEVVKSNLMSIPFDPTVIIPSQDKLNAKQEKREREIISRKKDLLRKETEFD